MRDLGNVAKNIFFRNVHSWTDLSLRAPSVVETLSTDTG